ncbi:hypothetical protein MUK42_18807 [Musa troglodytarum]|uniref:Uncharacterized protein n=1 Tax=Musa troglodytarum TaxID=320322 RepID=A0A9E7FB69_9LILI|nr:hypothetical protein MUK42_18807 [Musa troglodytarum]
MEDVMKALSKASCDLLHIVQHQQDQESRRSYPDDANPCKPLKEICRELRTELDVPTVCIHFNPSDLISQ